MGDHNVSIDQGVRRRALEAVVKTRLIKLELPFGVGPSASPSRLVDFGPHGVAGLPPDPSEGIPQRMMAADDQSANLAHERVETVGIQRLRTLTSRGPGFGCSGEIAPALVVCTACQRPRGGGGSGGGGESRPCIRGPSTGWPPPSASPRFKHQPRRPHRTGDAPAPHQADFEGGAREPPQPVAD